MTLTQFEWVAILLVRLSVGTEFFIAGYGKLCDSEKFSNYFAELGIPLPEIQAPFVAGLEFVVGIGLIIGLCTRLFAVPTLWNGACRQRRIERNDHLPATRV